MKSSAAPCCATSDLRHCRGRVFNIQRFSLHDGPGIRTVVFLQGCPMQCAWCANPEGISPHSEMRFAGASAPRRVGEIYSVEQVRQKVMADEVHYRVSGGGVTLSGGEMALQPAFARALLATLREEGIHTAVETSGFAPWSALEQACEYSQLIMYDLKLANNSMHLHYTGVGNRPILRNLQRLLAGDIPVRIRIPAIPQVNDGPEQAEQMMALIRALSRHSRCFTGIDLLPYHRFGVNKYALLGKPYRYGELHPNPGPADIAALQRAAERHGLSTTALSHCIA
ncbi:MULTISPECIES: glycyl-radical enzyme activating protein [unclassified Brenneria]|uniref:glycyl-radical enzyme activating protein n=1 Tax=unclassified Brenneria TaxID=2634434 RepID=UPI0018F105BF|nr:glycyl-radical enzyme activating protein [Brenneria sp. L3-3C-1]MBJ7221527.1 glycyl-radical enzyme activating protein [Brenneria sp. L3-3C-1]MEE3642769.1 glycyl-radical enzyme activating protein [Brenneria sp. L3_3C_1]